MDRSFGSTLSGSMGWNAASSRVEPNTHKQLADLRIPLGSSTVFNQDKENGRRISEIFSPSTLPKDRRFGLSPDSKSLGTPSSMPRYPMRSVRGRQTASPSDIAALAAQLAAETSETDINLSRASSGIEEPEHIFDQSPAVGRDSRASVSSVDLQNLEALLADTSDVAEPQTPEAANVPADETSASLHVSAMFADTTMPLADTTMSRGPAHRVKTPGKGILMPASSALTSKRKQKVIFGSPQAAEFNEEAPASAITALTNKKSLHASTAYSPAAFPPLNDSAHNSPTSAASASIVVGKQQSVTEDDGGSVESAETSMNSMILAQFEDDLATMESSVSQKKKARNRRKSSTSKAQASSSKAESVREPYFSGEKRATRSPARSTESPADESESDSNVQPEKRARRSSMMITPAELQFATEALESPVRGSPERVLEQPPKPPRTPTPRKTAARTPSRTAASPSPRRSPRLVPQIEQPVPAVEPVVPHASTSLSPPPQSAGLDAKKGRLGIAAGTRRRATLAGPLRQNFPKNTGPRFEPMEAVVPESPAVSIAASDRTANTEDMHALLAAYGDSTSMSALSLPVDEEEGPASVDRIPSILSISLDSIHDGGQASHTTVDADDMDITMQGNDVLSADASSSPTQYSPAGESAAMEDATAALPASLSAFIPGRTANSLEMEGDSEHTVELARGLGSFLCADHLGGHTLGEHTVQLPDTLSAYMRTVIESKPMSTGIVTLEEPTVDLATALPTLLDGCSASQRHATQPLYGQRSMPSTREANASRVSEASELPARMSAFLQTSVESDASRLSDTATVPLPSSVRDILETGYGAHDAIDHDQQHHLCTPSSVIASEPTFQCNQRFMPSALKFAEAGAGAEQGEMVESPDDAASEASNGSIDSVDIQQAELAMLAQLGVTPRKHAMAQSEPARQVMQDIGRMNVAPVPVMSFTSPVAKSQSAAMPITQPAILTSKTPSRQVLEAAIARSSRKQAFQEDIAQTKTATSILTAQPKAISLSELCDYAGLRFISDGLAADIAEEAYDAEPVAPLPTYRRKSMKLRRQSSVEVFAKTAVQAMAHNISTVADFVNHASLVPEKRSLEWATAALSSTVSSQAIAVESEIREMCMEGAQLAREQPFIFGAIWRAAEFIRAKALNAADIDDKLVTDADALITRVQALKDYHELEGRTNWLKWRQSILQKLGRDLKELRANYVSYLRTADDAIRGLQHLASGLDSIRESTITSNERALQLAAAFPDLQQAAAQHRAVAQDYRAAQAQRDMQMQQLGALEAQKSRILAEITAEKQQIEHERSLTVAAVETEKVKKLAGASDDVLTSATQRAQASLSLYNGLVAREGWALNRLTDGRASTDIELSCTVDKKWGIFVDCQLDAESSKIQKVDLRVVAQVPESAVPIDVRNFKREMEARLSSLVTNDAIAFGDRLRAGAALIRRASACLSGVIALRKHCPLRLISGDRVGIAYDWSSAATRQKLRVQVFIDSMLHLSDAESFPAAEHVEIVRMVGEDAQFDSDLKDAVLRTLRRCRSEGLEANQCITEVAHLLDSCLISDWAAAARL